MKTKFYLTENGNILNTEKGCFQTAGGQFLRRVFDEEMEYLIGVLTPIEVPQDFPESELPIWELLWDVEGEFLNEEDDLEPCLRSCYTREINGKREFCILIFPEYDLSRNVEVVDTDESPVYVQDDELVDVDCKKAELVEYAYKSSIEEIYKLGNPDLEERTRRYKILKEKGIEFPSSSKKRQRKSKNLKQ
jgi:hypothetical protein